MRPRLLKRSVVTVAAVAATVVAATALVSPTAYAASTVKGVSAADAKAAVETYAEGVEASYAASAASATAMQSAVSAFIANPTDATLAAAKQAWLTARNDYLPTEAFRFYDGPIDNPKDGPEGQINAWPMDEAYVDYVTDNANAGIINNTAKYSTITTAVLTDTNEQGGEKNISTGWHAIEFLLWGQDNNASGPGQRPVTDYTTAANASRRADYLRLTTNLLVDDLTALKADWAPNSAYREKFVSNPQKAIANILRGIGALSAGELAGERMSVAYETKDQEDEHSCFSDNTNADVVGDVIGIQRVYLGDFPGADGTSISDLVESVDPKLNTKLTDQIDESVQLTKAFPVPFEQMIAGPDSGANRKAMLTAITSIEDQGDLIAQVAKKFNVKITLEV